MQQVFEPCVANWRGIGAVSNSGLRIGGRFRQFDAKTGFRRRSVLPENRLAVYVAALFVGVSTPLDCGLFGNTCTPENPVGPCMVSSEGTCSAFFTTEGPVTYSEARVTLAHGSGGRLMHDLVAKLIIARLDCPELRRMDDSALLAQPGRLAFTTDSYVVNPIFFPGGDIGRLAVCGTVNDLSTAGAVPKYLSLSLILEEGLPIADLNRVIESVRDATLEAGVQVVTGDTKVVNRGCADRIFLNTSGIGLVPDGVNISRLQRPCRRQHHR